MPQMTKDTMTYLGDSVYVEIEDGMLKLTTYNDHPDDPRNIIFMDTGVYENLVSYVAKCYREASEAQAALQRLGVK